MRRGQGQRLKDRQTECRQRDTGRQTLDKKRQGDIHTETKRDTQIGQRRQR